MNRIVNLDKNKWLNLSLLILVIVTVTSALILINLGRFTTLTLDDFDYGMDLYHLIDGGNYSFIDVIRVALNKVVSMRDQWQGTYFGIFVMALNPLLFDSNLGWLLPATAISVILLGNVCLYSWIGKRLNIDRRVIWILILSTTLININSMPSTNEGMYWWISVSFYTASYLLVMSYFVLWMNLPKHRFLYSVAMLIVGFMLEGYCTHLLFLLACFAFALSAPGNFVREAQVAGVPAWLAVLESPFYALMHLLVYLSPATLLICGIVGYFLNMNRSVWSQHEKTIRSFWYLVSVILIYSAMFAPTIYGENHVAAGRYLNMLYLMHLPICLLITWFIVARYGRNFHLHIDVKLTAPVVIGAFAFLFSGLFNGHYEDFATLTALLDLRNGYAYQYQAETQQRNAILESEQSVVTIQKRTVYPRLFMVDDGTTDWVNEDMCEFYGKQEIIIDDIDH